MSPDGRHDEWREQIAERAARKRKNVRLGYRRIVVYALTVVGLLVFYGYAAQEMGRAPLVKGMEMRAADGESMFVRDRGPRVESLDEGDERQLDRQRRLVEELARRHIGRAPGGSESDDLRILQELVDSRVIASDAVYEQQALGIVLGDLMVRELGFEWVVIDDDLGRSRALRIGERGNFVYPVTMISKRYPKDIPVVVAELYAKARAVADAARARDRRLR